MSKRGMSIGLTLAILALSLGSGCAFKIGARDGVIDGSSAAISTAVESLLGQIFASVLPPAAE